jgi:hypothetical protein
MDKLNNILNVCLKLVSYYMTRQINLVEALSEAILANYNL